jgi:hypothetical protein
MTFWIHAIPTASYVLIAAWAARRLIEYYEAKKDGKGGQASHQTFTGEMRP